MKAAQALREALNEKRGAKIHLEKKVPIGAGLGGGSSDAAAACAPSLKLWNRSLPDADLASLAVRLGADVPFFLKGGLCSATGIGEVLQSMKPLPKSWLVLVYPGFGVNTKEAYARVRLPFADPRVLSSISASTLFNRFEGLVFPDYPVLPRLKEELLEHGAEGALMSGSGSSVFGVVKSQAAGEAILSALRPRYPQSWLVHTI